MPRGFEKGHKKIPGSGMQKGMKTKKTQAWELLGDFITQEGALRAIEILQTMPTKDFILSYEKFIEYFKPKLQRTDFYGEIDHKVNELHYNGNYLRTNVK